MSTVTCTAPVNIAVVKYWGKRDEKLILPINSSLSATLDMAQMCAKTSVAASPTFASDRMWLNGEEQSMNTSRLQNVLKEIKKRAHKRKDGHKDGVPALDWHIHICSENNFPTAAGLASSAAGYACLVYALAQLYKVQGEISDIARQGSGSACRSIYGGFVAWDMGSSSDGSDSFARSVAPQSHWPELRILVLVVSGKKKHIGSTSGMQTSVETSALLKHRAETIVPERMENMTQAILARDYQKFAELTIQDSNQMHAVCLDTYPPISYMTDTSRDITRLMHTINTFYGENKVAYTFDAGPNACLYLLEENVPLIMGLVQHFFPPQLNGEPFIQGIEIKPAQPSQELLSTIPLDPSAGAIKYVISTQVGPGPSTLPAECSLLDEQGMPIKVSQKGVES